MERARAWFGGWIVTRKGGPGSGNWGHAGRKGQRGGSLPRSSAMSLRTGETAPERQEYAKTGEKPAALIRKELLQETREIEAHEAELKTANSAKLKELDDYWNITMGPNREAKRAVVARHDTYESLQQDPEFQKLEAERKELDVTRDRLWEEQTAITNELIEIRETKRQLARKALLSDTPADVKLNFGKLRKDSRSPVQEGRQIFADLVENRPSLNGQTLHVRRPTYYGKHRAYYQDAAAGRPSAIHMPAKTSARTTVHEMGHWLEDMDPSVHRRALAFLQARIAGQKPQRLSEIYRGVSGYQDHEVAVKDQFMHAYMGKIYGGRATEIISMGLEYLAFDALEFARQDPEYFDLMVDIVRGR